MTPRQCHTAATVKHIAIRYSESPRNQNLAEATILAGTSTVRHRHDCTEEIYHVIADPGMMTLGSELFVVAAGDTVLIPAGASHCVANIGDVPLRILCCISKGFSVP